MCPRVSGRKDNSFFSNFAGDMRAGLRERLRAAKVAMGAVESAQGGQRQWISLILGGSEIKEKNFLRASTRRFGGFILATKSSVRGLRGQ